MYALPGCAGGVATSLTSKRARSLARLCGMAEMLDGGELRDALSKIGALEQVNVWLARGDGVAVYENKDLAHPQLGHRQYLSYGSNEAQIEKDVPPQQMPDLAGQAPNWRYRLLGTYRGEPL